MMKNINDAPNTGANRSQWLARRRKGIGGSDTASLLGLSKYSSPYIIWADKTGKLPEKDDTPQMRLGRDLEAYVAERFTEQTGLKTRRDGRTITNQQYPYSYAHIDRRIVGQSTGLECKTCSPYRSGEFDEHEYPIEYYTQALHYLAITGWDKWYIAVLILDGTFQVYEILRQDVLAEINELQEQITFFWESFVLTDTPPPMDGKKATTDALSQVHNTTKDAEITLNHLENHCFEILSLEKQVKEIQSQIERRKQEIKQAMGKNILAKLGAWFASWKPNKKGVRSFKLKIG